MPFKCSLQMTLTCNNQICIPLHLLFFMLPWCYFIQKGDPLFQKNEGRWEFTLEESKDGKDIELDVAVGRFLDSSLIKADVQPLYVRLLIKVRFNA